MVKNKLPQSNKSVVKIQDFEESSLKIESEYFAHTQLDHVPEEEVPEQEEHNDASSPGCSNHDDGV